MIVDLHTHAFPDELAPRALEVLSTNCRLTPYTDGTCGGLIASMRRVGIDKAAVMTIATKPAQVRSINKWAAMVSREHEELICFGSLHPMQEDWQEEIDLLVQDGVPGVKFHPDYQQFFVDDPQAIPLYRALADAGLIVLFHAGVDIGLPPPVHCTPPRLAAVLDSVLGLTVIAAHMGGYQCWDEVEEYLLGRELYLETSFSLAYMGSDRMASLIQRHGTERVLFGTDSPWADQTAEVEGIRNLPFTESKTAAIMGGNASRLLKLG